MKFRTFSRAASALTMATVLAACGGGGGSGTTALVPGAPLVHTDETGPDSFLLFPNPIVQVDGSKQTDTLAYAEAYYRAVDPTNAKDTLDKWKAANGFGSAPGALGEVSAIFGDVRDLGYGRHITGRQNADGTIAFMVKNFQVATGGSYGYSSVNLDAAIAADDRWHIGTNAIEYSPGPDGGKPFAKFYTFDPKTGARLLAANLDGRGDKAMPGICITCHGGRGDPLTPPDATGKPRFPLVANSSTRQRGDTLAHMQFFDVASFQFSNVPGFTRAELEPKLKTLNQMVLCTYPLAGTSTAPEDACRAPADENDWQGTAAVALKGAYGGDGMPNATFAEPPVPSAWENAGQETLYRNVVYPSCMTCHQMRGTGNQSDLDFQSYAKFRSYSDRIKAHVFERGNMPLVELVYDAFWGNGRGTTLAGWLENIGLGSNLRDGAGKVSPPGRPVAAAGPDRVVSPGATQLSARSSLFADTFKWTLASNPGNAATLSSDTSATPTFTASAEGTYVVQLVASRGDIHSLPVQQTILVKAGLSPASSAVRFADVKAIIQGSGGCTACHAQSVTSGRPPVIYEDFDRNGDGAVDATDDAWLYADVYGRVNFTDVGASAILRKPSGNHHFGNLLPGFDATKPLGSSDRASYDLVVNWIANGAPR